MQAMGETVVGNLVSWFSGKGALTRCPRTRGRRLSLTKPKLQSPRNDKERHLDV